MIQQPLEILGWIYLWDKEKKKCLAEVAKDGDDCQRHPAEVTKCVPWKSDCLMYWNWQWFDTLGLTCPCIINSATSHLPAKTEDGYQL